MHLVKTLIVITMFMIRDISPSEIWGDNEQFSTIRGNLLFLLIVQVGTIGGTPG